MPQCYLPPDRGDIPFPAFNLAKLSWYSISRPRRDARLITLSIRLSAAFLPATYRIWSICHSLMDFILLTDCLIMSLRRQADFKTACFSLHCYFSVRLLISGRLCDSYVIVSVDS